MAQRQNHLCILAFLTTILNKSEKKVSKIAQPVTLLADWVSALYFTAPGG